MRKLNAILWTRHIARPLLASLVFFAISAGVTHADSDSGDVLSHDAFSRLLTRCVHPTGDGGSTAVDYGCFSDNRAALDAYLSSLSSISEARLMGWPRDAQLAFLINAYNAATVELILTAWPELDSIRDLGSLLRSPWKKPFVELLGRRWSLDNIEHDMIRDPGRFDEPRIHFAVNCASIGCPALRREAYMAANLDEQLEDQTRRFLGDRSRNRLGDGELQVSSLFKWYRGDFEKGWRGAESLPAFLILYAEALALDTASLEKLRRGALPIEFLDYDWTLNGTGPR